MPAMRQQPRLVYQPQMYQRLIDLARAQQRPGALHWNHRRNDEGSVYDAVDTYSKQEESRISI